MLRRALEPRASSGGGINSHPCLLFLHGRAVAGEYEGEAPLPGVGSGEGSSCRRTGADRRVECDEPAELDHRHGAAGGSLGAVRDREVHDQARQRVAGRIRADVCVAGDLHVLGRGERHGGAVGGHRSGRNRQGGGQDDEGRQLAEH
jgi:hypothetical protein